MRVYNQLLFGSGRVALREGEQLVLEESETGRTAWLWRESLGGFRELAYTFSSPEHAQKHITLKGD